MEWKIIKEGADNDHEYRGFYEDCECWVNVYGDYSVCFKIDGHEFIHMGKYAPRGRTMKSAKAACRRLANIIDARLGWLIDKVDKNG